MDDPLYKVLAPNGSPCPDPSCPCRDGDPCHYEDDPVTGTEGMVRGAGEGGGTDFDYLLNAMEIASGCERPREHGYKEKHEAVCQYVATLHEENERLKSAPRFMCPYCAGGETDDVDEVVAHCETCEARPEFHLKRALAALRKLAHAVCQADIGVNPDAPNCQLNLDDKVAQLAAHLDSTEPETARRGAETEEP